MAQKGFISFIFKAAFFLLFASACKPDEVSTEGQAQRAFRLNLPVYFGDFFIPANNPITEEGVELGRMLFYEKKLSIDSSISCASCHLQQHAFSDPRRFSVGVNGQTPRNSMALVNLIYNRSFFWDGRSPSLENQALQPIEDHVEMGLTLEEAVRRLSNLEIYQQQFQKAFSNNAITAENIAKAIAQFERVLVSADSKFDKYLNGKASLTTSEYNGMVLFQTHPEPERALRGGNCGDCHTAFRTDGLGFENNGLESQFKDFGRFNATGRESDKGKFRIPTLRNIAVTAPYMHDGRFKTLEEVLDHYNEHIQNSATLSPLIMEASNSINGAKLELTEQEKQDIISFLHTLTDSTFLNNPKFADPFKK